MAPPGSLSPRYQMPGSRQGMQIEVTPALTLALGDSSLCCGPRTVCGDNESVRRGAGVTAGDTLGLTWHPLLLAQPLPAP